MFKNILKIAGIILIASLLFSCEEDSGDEVSVKERIEKFENTLNDGDYDDLNKHFHPDMDSYDTYMAADVISSGPLRSENSPFDFSTPTTTDSGSDKIATGTWSNNVGYSDSYSAVMREDGDDNWKIFSIDLGGTYVIEGISR